MKAEITARQAPQQLAAQGQVGIGGRLEATQRSDGLGARKATITRLRPAGAPRRR